MSNKLSWEGITAPEGWGTSQACGPPLILEKVNRKFKEVHKILNTPNNFWIYSYILKNAEPSVNIVSNGPIINW
jgi:hypothetical protein